MRKGHKRKSAGSTPDPRWYYRMPWLTAIGSFLFFLSWISENVVEKQWQNDREERNELRLRIITNDILANVWLSAMLHQRRQLERDISLESTMALQYTNFSHQVR